MAEFPAKTEQRKRKTYCPIAVMNFLKSFCLKNMHTLYVHKPRRKIGQSFRESTIYEEVLAF